MQTIYTFAETSPAAASSVASSQAVAWSNSPYNGTGGFTAGVTASAGIAVGDLDRCDSLWVYAALVGATGGTLDVLLQTSPNNGTTWVEYAHLPQLAAGAAAIQYSFAVSRGGQILTATSVGIGTNHVIAAGTILGGAWGDRFRLLMVAGAGTSAGAPVSVVLNGRFLGP